MTGAAHIRNLLELFDSCDAGLRAEALQSYRRYNRILRGIGDPLGVHVQIACAVFSALSPNNDYVGNLRDCRRMLTAARTGQDIDSFKVSTYGANKRKGWAIIKGEMSPDEAIVARKTRAFYHNCWLPDDPRHVTVDGHIYWCYMGRRGSVRGRGTALESPPSLGKALYEEIADAVRFVAEIRGVVPCQAQAVIWQNYRVRYNVQRSKQLELIPADLHVAGVLEEFLQ